MYRNLNKLGRNKEIVVTDSQDQKAIDLEYLLGGIINIIRNNIVIAYDKSKIEINKLGKQIAITLVNNKKSVVIIIIYRILFSNNSSICKLLI